jgi:hypothetical protein
MYILCMYVCMYVRMYDAMYQFFVGYAVILFSLSKEHAKTRQPIDFSLDKSDVQVTH